jgi:hypothetical protein
MLLLAGKFELVGQEVVGFTVEWGSLRFLGVEGESSNELRSVRRKRERKSQPASCRALGAV